MSRWGGAEKKVKLDGEEEEAKDGAREGFSGNSTTAKSDIQSRVISRPTVPFDLPKSRLPSVFHPTARQSCSLGSKRFGTDLSKLYGTTPISDLFLRPLPVSPPSFSFSFVSPCFLLSICSPPRHRTLVTINPTKTFSLLGAPPINRIPVAVFLPQAFLLFFIALASYVIDLYFNDLFLYFEEGCISLILCSREFAQR